MLALVTGASSGIGKALAHEHAKQGGDLILVARREEKLRSTAEEFGSRYGIKVEVIAKDLARRESPHEIFEAVQDRNLTIDFLINNAGFGGQGYFHERPWQQDQSMIEVNVMALTALTRLFLPGFVQRNRGRILNVASTAGMVPAGPLQSVYFATKAYVLSFSQGIAGELMDTGVTVTALCPGPIATEFSETAGLENTPLFARSFPPEQVAEQGYRAMLEGKLVKVTGVSLTQRLTFALSRFVPRKLFLRQVKKMQSVQA